MTEQTYPAWFYGPKGEAEVFEKESDVPKGWKDHQFAEVPAEEPVEAPATFEVQDVPAKPTDAPEAAQPLSDRDLDPDFSLNPANRPLAAVNDATRFGAPGSPEAPEERVSPEVEAFADPPGFAAFDPDHNNEPGGSLAGEESTVKQGQRKRRRKRKA